MLLATERAHTSTTDTRTLALRLADGDVTATTDPDASVITVTLSARTVHGPAAHAVRHALIGEHDGVMTVELPAPPPARGAGAVRDAARRSTTFPVDGAVPDRVAVEIVLPPGAVLKFESVAGSLATEGCIREITARTVTGGLDLDSVGALTARTVEGAVRVRTLTGPAAVGTVTGPVEIGCYEGHHVKLTTVSGPVSVTVGPGASGALLVDSVAGHIVLRGARRVGLTTAAASRFGTLTY